MNRFLRLSLFFVFQFLAVFVLCEIGVRTFLAIGSEDATTFESSVPPAADRSELLRIPPPVTMGRLIQKSRDSNRVFELIPNVEAVFLGKPYRSNSFGMRDIEYALAKPRDTKRVIALGDSVMFGWGVTEQESYLAHMEAAFAARNAASPVEILNFAVPGYNTHMEVATYESHARHFQPDVVLIHFVDNDFNVPLFLERPANLWSLNKSFFVEKLQDVLNPSRRGRQDLIGLDMGGIKKPERKRVLKKYWPMVGEHGFRRAMKKLSVLAREDGATVAIIVGNPKKKMRQLLYDKVARPYGFHVIEVGPAVDAYLKQQGIANTPEERRRLFWLNKKDSHPNVLGHELYASAILPVLEQLLNKQ